MTITGKLSEAEYLGIRELFWAPHFRLSLLNHVCLRDIGLLWIMVYVAFATGICKAVRQPWRSGLFTLAWLIGASFVAWRMRCKLHLSPTELEKLNRDVPHSYALNDDAVEVYEQGGLSTSIPWHLLVHWQDGGLVLIANFGSANQILMLPCEQLDVNEAAALRATLHSRIGEPLP